MGPFAELRLSIIFMRRSKSICRKINCDELLDAPGYCDKCYDRSTNFSELKKADGSEKFYGSYKWKKTRSLIEAEIHYVKSV